MVLPMAKNNLFFLDWNWIESGLYWTEIRLKLNWIWTYWIKAGLKMEMSKPRIELDLDQSQAKSGLNLD